MVERRNEQNRPKVILFIEDEQELRDAVYHLLRDQGYDVVAVETAEEALVKLKERRPDLILADVKLPGLDGLDFYKELKKTEEFRSIPCVFLTAFNNLAAREYARNLGAAEYITKPFDFEDLAFRVRELVPP